MKNLNKRKTFRPEKCVVTLKLQIINKSSEVLETKIRKFIKKTYDALNPRIVLMSKTLLTKDEDPISNLQKEW